MKQKIILLFSTLLVAFVQDLHGAEKSDSSKIYFENAFGELKDMLEGKLTPDFERAVFISENAYHDNKYSYENFRKVIDIHLYCIKKLIEANDKSDSIEFNVKVNANGRFKMDEIRYLPREKKELYRKALINWAIFTYLTDTTAAYPFYHLPFSYATHDPFGMKEWSNSQVINLLSSKEQKGNCFALTGLFKILSDCLNSEARICTAPQHIYIQHRDHKGDYYNVELATAGHPGDGLIQTLTYTTSEAIMSGIALRSYDETQSIGLCLVNLAKSYEHKFRTKEDAFILRCAELVLKHDSLNLNALLLKQQTLDTNVTDYAVKNRTSSINRLKQDPRIAKTVTELEKHLTLLYTLGYRQMPMDMQEMVLNGFRKEDNGRILTDKNPSPFTTVKPKDPNDARYLSLTGGVFQEVFEHRELEPYGHFTFKTATSKITAIDTASPTGFLIDPVAFAYDFGARMYDARTGIFISTDPLEKKYVGWSPYTAFADNPIRYVDVGGLGPGDRIKAAIMLTQISGVRYNAVPDLGTGVRTAYTTQALSELDCAEFVCRVFAADLITPGGVKNLVRESFLEFVEDENRFSKSSTATKGAIAVWYGIKTDKEGKPIKDEKGNFVYGFHTGVVTDVDKNKDYKLAHATYRRKDAKPEILENPYYTTTKKYRSDIPFIGFFTPVDETPDDKNVKITEDTPLPTAKKP